MSDQTKHMLFCFCAGYGAATICIQILKFLAGVP